MALIEYGFIRKTGIVFAASGGDAVYSAHSTVGTLTGRKSARYDIGVTNGVVKPRLYEWRAIFKNGAGTPPLGNLIQLYLITASASTGAGDGQLDESDAAITTDQRRNLICFGAVVVDVGTANSIWQASGHLWIRARYIQVAHWNGTPQSISAVSGDHTITLTPIPDATA